MKPTDEDIAAFNAAVQHHIDTQAALGITLSWDDAVIQFGNLLTNLVSDPEWTDPVSSHEQRITELEAQVAYLLDVTGTVVVGGDPEPG
jgi:hypothetical protein